MFYLDDFPTGTIRMQFKINSIVGDSIEFVVYDKIEEGGYTGDRIITLTHLVKDLSSFFDVYNWMRPIVKDLGGNVRKFKETLFNWATEYLKS